MTQNIARQKTGKATGNIGTSMWTKWMNERTLRLFLSILIKEEVNKII